MDLRILIFFVYFAFDGALAGSDLFSYFKNLYQSSGPVTVITKPRLWPNGIIPYEISPHFSEYSRQMIMKAIDHIHENSCVRFVERTSQDAYVQIVQSDTCQAVTGYWENSWVKLSPLCTTKIGSIQHELMHVMGFSHEHSRPDRDKYITVFEDNIEPEYLSEFKKDEIGDSYTFGLPYDYESVMHYSADSVARSPYAPTMVAKDNKYRKLGQQDKLSQLDIEKINAIYPCHGQSPMSKKKNSIAEKDYEMNSYEHNTNNEDFDYRSIFDPEYQHPESNNHEYEYSDRIGTTDDFYSLLKKYINNYSTVQQPPYRRDGRNNYLSRRPSGQTSRLWRFDDNKSPTVYTYNIPRTYTYSSSYTYPYGNEYNLYYSIPNTYYSSYYQ